MKRRFFTLFLLSISFSVVGQFAGGSGSENDPWQIATIEQLALVNDYLNGSFILINDLDFTGSNYDSIHSSSGWLPLGNSLSRFTGSFNGAGHTISNLYINKTGDNNGFFGYTSGAKIDSLELFNCNVSGRHYTSGLVGYCFNSEISGCCVTGRISGENNASGIAGQFASSAISNCYVMASISGSYNVGGLAGENISSSTISNCYATGVISGESNVGGVIGVNSSSIIANCYSTARISGERNVGGLIGYNSINVSSIVTGGYYNTETSNQSTGIGADYNYQTVIGVTTSEMKQSGNFPEFDFSSVWDITPGVTLPRLRAVYNAPVILYDLPTYVQINSPQKDTIKLITMDGESASLSLEGNPGGMTLQDSILIWIPNEIGFLTFTLQVTDNNGLAIRYPNSIIVHPYEGSGTVEDPFRVTSIEGLDFIRNMPDKDYKLTKNLDFAGSKYDSINNSYGWVPLGDDENLFTGSFNGSGYCIRNLYAKGGYDDRIGLFGSTDGAKFDSIGVIDCNISGDYRVGGLVGVARSSIISNCYASGRVSGNVGIGGLAGSITGVTELLNSYATCDVSGVEMAGGLVGANYPNTSVSDCYATGSVSGNIDVGGLVGLNYSTAAISNSYATGRVSGNSTTNTGGLVGSNTGTSTITNGYYNSETSGQTNGIGLDENSQNVIGLTTAQMKKQGSFIGFDFSTVWGIRADTTCPAIRTVNNAPFAFTDSITVGASIRPEQLLGNDYDYETLQSSLVANIESISDGYIQNNIAYLSDAALVDDIIIVSYRVGEIRLGDTLWSGAVHSIITVGLNTAPVISSVPWSLNANEDVALIEDLSSLATDADLDEIQYILTDSTKNGSLIIEGNRLTYSPKRNYNGTDSLRIKASDGLLYSDSVWIRIHIAAVNDAPVLTTVSELRINAGDSLTLSLEDVNAYDIDRDILSLVVYPGSNYSIGANPLTVLPDNNFDGTLEVPVAVTDGSDTSAIMRLSIEVVNTNNPPVISSGPWNFYTDEDVALIEDLSSLATDPNYAEIQYILTDSTKNGSLVIEGNRLTYSPLENFNGADSLRIKASDGLLYSDSVWIRIHVAAVNDAPVLTAVSELSLNEDDSLVLSLENVNALDVDGDLLSLVIYPGNNYSIGENSYTVVPHENYNGILNVPVAVTDGSETSAIDGMSIEVLAVNDTPVINSTAPDVALVGQLYTYTVLATDIDGDDLTFTLNSAPDGMTISSNEIRWTPAEGTTSSGEVILAVSDGQLTANETFSIEVAGYTGLENVQSLGFDVFPNPTQGDFTIQLTEKYREIGLSMSDLDGKNILAQRFYNTDQIEAKISGQNGIYIVNIELEEKTVTMKIIKNDGQ